MEDPGNFKRVHLKCIFMWYDKKEAMCENHPHMVFLTLHILIFFVDFLLSVLNEKGAWKKLFWILGHGIIN